MASPVSTFDPLAGLTARDAMHHGILAVPDDATPYDAAAVMAGHGVHAVVVAGVVVRSDLDVIAAALDDHPLHAHTVRPLPRVDLDAPLQAVAELMATEDATHVLVASEEALLPAGMVSAFDLAALVAGRHPRLARLLRPVHARPVAQPARLDRLTVDDLKHTGVIAIGPATSLVDLAAVLADRHVHAVSVAGTVRTEGGRRLVWGVATDLDVVRTFASGHRDALAGEISGTEPLVVDATDPAESAARLLVEHGVTHAIVADAAGQAVGVLSTLDVLAVLAGGR